MEPEIVKKDHVLKKWMVRNYFTGEESVKLTFGVTQAVFSHIYNGGRVSPRMIEKLENQGVPKSIINKLRKQGR